MANMGTLLSGIQRLPLVKVLDVSGERLRKLVKEHGNSAESIRRALGKAA